MFKEKDEYEAKQLFELPLWKKSRKSSRGVRFCFSRLDRSF